MIAEFGNSRETIDRIIISFPFQWKWDLEIVWFRVHYYYSHYTTIIIPFLLEEEMG